MKSTRGVRRQRGRGHAAPSAFPWRQSATAATILGLSLGAAAQTNPTAPRPLVEEQRQQERERALRQQQEATVDARLQAPTAGPAERLPDSETPCFRIERLSLVGEASSDFQWLLEEADGRAAGLGDSPIGRCIGTRGANIVLARLQQALVARGWTTTRVLAAPQDLAGGILALTLVPGRVASMRFADSDGATTSLRSALPLRAGELLNLRDIEQGLENLQRLPTAQADIQIQPSQAPDAKPGDSELLVKYAQKTPPLRATLSLDDSGTEATGKTQAGATVAWDGPLGLNDLAYVSLNHDAFNHSDQGTRGYTAHYSVPYGYWLFGATASASSYHQTVAGLNDGIVYSGESSNVEVRASRLLHRDASRKTSASLRAFGRDTRNAIDGEEVRPQTQHTKGWELGLNHREFIGSATLDANLAYRSGRVAFVPLYAGDNPPGLPYHLLTADANLDLPFELAGQRLRYSAQWRAQWNRTPLAPRDNFAIGGRYTVRGFDGELSLSGERGWLIRNDIGWAVGPTGAELYAGIDHGQVGGPATAYQLGTRLTGGAIGVRGAWQGLNYDVFVGAPISRPEGFRTAKVTAGFNLNYSF